LFSFVSAGLGRPPGLGIAFVAVLGYTVASSVAIGPFAVFADQATQSLSDWSSPWQLGAVLGVVAMGVLGVLNIGLNLRTLGIIMILEVLALRVLAVAIIAKAMLKAVLCDTEPRQHLSRRPRSCHSRRVRGLRGL
jgi:hypothetical protein